MPNQEILVCPPWPGRNPFADARKVSCSECKQHVSITAQNLPHLANVVVICEECCKRLMEKVPAEEFNWGTENLPGSGIEKPLSERQKRNFIEHGSIADKKDA